MEFVDRLLTCVDCGGEFIFTAGEQLFFLDKQFKNDPKRCKPCKSRRSAASTGASPGSGPAAAGISRTETRTECSECGISTTVPFKPTQGRPVLCRQCFKNKRIPATTDTLATTVPANAIAPPGAPALVPPAVSVASEPQAELSAQPSSAA
jgi:CxxC-x17-CxxC domain-containing protein